MKYSVTVFFFSLAVVLAAGCGKGGGRGGGKGPGQGREDPTLELTDTQRKNFDAWKGSLLKSCDAASAFNGEQKQGEVGLDARQVLKRTGGGLVLKGNKGDFAVLGWPKGFLGTSDSKIAESESVDIGDAAANTRSFVAEARRSGRECRVLIGDELVYETQIWSALPVALTSPGVLPQASVTSVAPEVTEGSLVTHGLFEAFAEAMQAPGKHLEELLAGTFSDLSSEQRQSFFPLSNARENSIRVAAVLVDGTSRFVFDEDYAAIRGSTELMQRLTAPTGQAQMDVLFKVPRLAFADVANDSDQGLWSVGLQVRWSPSDAADLTAPRRHLRLERAVLSGRVGFDPKRFSDCTAVRRAVFAQTLDFGSGRFAPSFGGTAGPCRVFAEDLGASLNQDAELLAHMLGLLSGVEGSPGLNLNGWEQALQLLTVHHAKQGSDLGARLDPQGQSPLVTAADRYLQLLKKSGVRQGPLSGMIEILAERFAYRWAAAGAAVPDADVLRYLKALTSTYEVLPSSTMALLSDLSASPSDPSHVASVDYALKLTKEVMNRLADLERQADAADLARAFESQKLSKVLQSRFAPEVFERWRVSLQAIASFKALEKQRADALKRWFVEERDVTGVIDRALSEDWLGSEFTALEAFAKVAVLAGFCDGRATASAQVACRDSRQVSKNQGLLLDPAFKGRYVGLASSLAAQMEALSGNGSSRSLRDDIARALFRPMWQLDDHDTFQKKAEQLKQLVSRYPSASFSERFDIERSVRDVLNQ